MQSFRMTNNKIYNYYSKVPKQKAHTIIRALESRIIIIVFSIIFKLSLEFSYWAFVSPLFTYMGFVWDANYFKCIEAWLLYFVILGIAPYRLFKPSDFFLALLLFLYITPLLSFYWLADQNRYHLYIVLMGYVLILIFRSGRLIRIPFIKGGPYIAGIIIISSMIGISIWFVTSGGISYFNIDVTKIYDYRSIARETISVGIIGYINTWTYFVFGPAFLCMALWIRYYSLAVLTVILYIYWFGVSSHTIVLFVPLPVIIFYLFFHKTRALSLLPLFLFFLVGTSTLISLSFNSLYPATWFPRRAFYIPAMLTFDYYDFFSVNQKIWWSNSVFSLGLSEYPYPISYGKLIGEFKGTTSNANNSFLATGFMHAGISGIVIYGVLTGLIFRIIDSLSHTGIPIWIVSGILAMPFLSLIMSSDLPTALLTRGLGIGIIMIFLMRSTNHIY